jgi:hypothetical protein
VKPSNVLLDESGNCLLSDFGLAKIIEASEKLTMSGAIMGTPAYMSPEQGMGKTLDGRSDIYSLGVILYEMATGRPPYKAETPMAVMIKHISDPLPPPSTINPDFPDEVEAVILKALAKNPDDRYQMAGAMVKGLQAALTEVEHTSPTKVIQPELIAVGATMPELVTETLAKGSTRVKPARARKFSLTRVLAVVIGLIVVGGIGVAILPQILVGPISTQKIETEAVAVATVGITQESAQSLTTVAQVTPTALASATFVNVALNKPVKTSSFSQEAPSEFAVDGDFETAWVAEDHAVQWIEIDLQTPLKIQRVRLFVMQDSGSETTYRIWGKGRGEESYKLLLHTFSKITKELETLQYTPASPWTDIQFIKVETTQSSSLVKWREVEIFTFTK